MVRSAGSTYWNSWMPWTGGVQPVAKLVHATGVTIGTLVRRRPCAERRQRAARLGSHPRSMAGPRTASVPPSRPRNSTRWTWADMIARRLDFLAGRTPARSPVIAAPVALLGGRERRHPWRPGERQSQRRCERPPGADRPAGYPAPAVRSMPSSPANPPPTSPVLGDDPAGTTQVAARVVSRIGVVTPGSVRRFTSSPVRRDFGRRRRERRPFREAWNDDPQDTYGPTGH